MWDGGRSLFEETVEAEQQGMGFMRSRVAARVVQVLVSVWDRVSNFLND
jgi:hypothetical protein